jgi:hypothetical protein
MHSKLGSKYGILKSNNCGNSSFNCSSSTWKISLACSSSVSAARRVIGSAEAFSPSLRDLERAAS